MSAQQTPTSYTELAGIIERLPQLVIDTRRARGLSLRAAAADADLGFTTLVRVEAGENVSAKNLAKLLRWLDQTGAR